MVRRITAMILVIAIFSVMCFSVEAITNPFTDINKNDYFYEPVLWGLERGVTEGTSATRFSPYADCTRAQIVTFMWNAAGKPEPKRTTCQFTDVEQEKWYYKPVLWAVEQGITNGMTKTEFKPNDKCTRAQIVTFLWRYGNKRYAQPHITGQFSDVKSSDYFFQAVRWALEAEITVGTSNTTFSPNKICSRAQAITMLYRARWWLYGNNVKTVSDVTKRLQHMQTVYPDGTDQDVFYSYTWVFPGHVISNQRCWGFACMMQDAVWGYPSVTPVTSQTISSEYTIHPEDPRGLKLNAVPFRFEDLRPSDIIAFKEHAVVVLEVHAGYVVVAESGYGTTTLWGRRLSQSYIEKNGQYVLTRWDKTKPVK